MKWIANKRNPPKYIWDGDEWYNESDQCFYLPDFINEVWQCEDRIIPFPKSFVHFSL